MSGWHEQIHNYVTPELEFLTAIVYVVLHVIKYVLIDFAATVVNQT